MELIEFYEFQSTYKPRLFEEIMDDAQFPILPEIENKKVGVLVGSRGINNIDTIVKATIEDLQNQGATPYIVPAMGSHGGATVDGQISLLAEYGITPERMNTEIISSSEVTTLGEIFEKSPVVVNDVVNELDYLVGINRIKPHPRFNGDYESGILKLLSVGLGSFEGAKNFHRTIENHGFEETLTQTSHRILESLRFLYFMGIVEDKIGQTLKIEYIPPNEIYSREKELLNLARENMPSIPLSDIDLLIVNEMGKNYSGGGIDTCVVGGRKGKKRIAKRIYVRSLSEESEGNAVGMGLADFISGDFYHSIDFHKTYKNALSSMALESVKVPVWLDSDREVIAYAAESIGKSINDDIRIAWIDNTSDLRKIYVTPNLAKDGIVGYTCVDKRLVGFDKNGAMVM